MRLERRIVSCLTAATVLLTLLATPAHADPAIITVGAFYPSESRRLGEQGTAIVKICVDPYGARIGEPIIVNSTGYPRLDDAAIRYAAALRFKPHANTRGDGCSVLPVKFKLN
jgi:TonB family protein